jgi:hypothetical protein
MDSGLWDMPVLICLLERDGCIFCGDLAVGCSTDPLDFVLYLFV